MAERQTPLLPRTAAGLATFYNMMHGKSDKKPGGFDLAPHMNVPVQALMDKRINNLLVIVGPGSGKSVLFDVTFPAFELGHDPTETILGISAGESLVQGFQRAVAEWIEFDETYHTIFPGVLPDKVAGWSTDRGLYVTGHIPGNPDSNYFTCGLTSSALTGKHASIILGDDLHNKENSAGYDQCMKVRGDYHQTILGRQNPAGCRKIFTGRRWHIEDIYGFLKSTGEYVVLELPAVREKGNELYWTVTVPDGLECCFTDGSMQNISHFEDSRAA